MRAFNRDSECVGKTSRTKKEMLAVWIEHLSRNTRYRDRPCSAHTLPSALSPYHLIFMVTHTGVHQSSGPSHVYAGRHVRMHTHTIPGPYVTQGRYGSLAVNLPCAQVPMLLPGIHQALLKHPSPIFPDRKDSHLQLSPIWSGSSLSDSGTLHCSTDR